jgi:hypothetical protein
VYRRLVLRDAKQGRFVTREADNRTPDDRVRDSMPRYNTRVPPSVRNNEKDEHHDSQDHDSQPHHGHAVYATETAGLLLIAALLLVITLIRYWHDIRWSLR